MHPVLFTLPLGAGFDVHVYGIMGALGFLAALAFIVRESRRYGLDPDVLTNLGVGAVLMGLAGSRLLFVALNWSVFQGDVGKMLNFRDGGLVFLGGMVAALVFSVWYARAKRVDVWVAGDVVLPGLALAQGLGRVGCLSAGCCHGRPTTLPIGITFDPTGVGPLEPGIRYLPVQAFESASYILLFLGLVWLLRRRRFRGQVFMAWFLAYGALRFSLELLRGDAERGFVWEAVLGPGVLSTSQAICLGLFLVGLGGMGWRMSRREGPGAAPSVGA